MQIYGFAFGKGNISAWTLWRLKNIDCCYQVFGEKSIDGYLRFLLHNKPEYILGLGVYSGIDQDKIRIEAKCSNQFRNGFMEGNKLQELNIKPYLEPLENSKFGEGIGNSYCNMASWKIMNLINQNKLSSRYTFLHIPKIMKVWFAVAEIDKMLEILKKI
jgi:hypothetical protein